MSRIDDAGIEILDDAGGLITHGRYAGGTTPTTANKFAVGCVLVDSTTGKSYYNAGTVASPSWNSVSEVNSAEIDSGVIQYAEVALTNAEIKALRATPKTLVAAPGAGYFLQFLGATLLLDYGSNGLTESTDNAAVKLNNGSGTQVSQDIEMTGFIDQTADTITCAQPKIDAIVSKSNGENKALVLHNTGDGEWGGNAANDTLMRVKVAYRVVATGF